MSYSSSWSNYVIVTVDHTKVPADLASVPVYLDLSLLPAGFWSTVQNGGGDIRVTSSDGTTEISREVVSCDTGGTTGELHFLAPSLSSSLNTDFYIYFGNSSASDYAATATYGRNAVWTSYVGVWHLEAATTGAAPQFVDSTGNGHGGTVNGTASAGDSVAGILGNCISFNGTSGPWIQTSALVTGSGSRTIAAWIKSLNNTGGSSPTIAAMGSSANGTRYSVRVDNVAGSALRTEVAGGYNYGTTDLYNSWHHVASVLPAGGTDVTAVNHYIDGTLDAVGASSSQAINTGSGTGLSIGNDAILGSRQFYGTIDEVRLSATDFSQSRITTEYNNQSSPTTFFGIGSVQSNGGGTTVALTGNAATANAGTLSPGLSIPMAGQAASSSHGAPGAALSIGLTGQSATTAQGAMTANLSILATGQVATSAHGAMTPGISLPLTGNAATASAGSLGVPGNVTVALTGNQATTQAGTLTPGISAALIGEAATMGAGSVTPGISVLAVGNEAVSHSGALTAGLSVGLTGQALTAAVGALTITGQVVTVQLTGQQATATVGTLTPRIVQIEATTNVWKSPGRGIVWTSPARGTTWYCRKR